VLSQHSNSSSETSCLGPRQERGRDPIASATFRPLWEDARDVFTALVAMKADHCLAPLFACWVRGGIGLGMFFRVLACWLPDGGPSFPGRFATWDAAQYMGAVPLATEEQHERPKDQRPDTHKTPFPFRPVLLCLVLLLTRPPGWAICFSLLWCWTGNALKGFAAQKHLSIHSVTNVWDLPAFLVTLLSPTAWHGSGGSMLERAAFILLLSWVPTLWRFEKSALACGYSLGGTPAMSRNFTSFMRFVSGAFPVLAVLGISLCGRAHRWPRLALLWGFSPSHGAIPWQFVSFRWAV
jgi:hypothetical protein